MGLKKKLNLIWKETAQISLYKIYFFIRNDSPSNAKKVRVEIVELAKSLVLFPQKYSNERFSSSKKEDIRSVHIYNYKIIFEVTNTEIIILDIFHTSRNPEDISK